MRVKIKNADLAHLAVRREFLHIDNTFRPVDAFLDPCTGIALGNVSLKTSFVVLRQFFRAGGNVITDEKS